MDERENFSEVPDADEERQALHFLRRAPTANGQPGIHHVLARVYKDVIVRYKTMAGFFVERKAGWDTHGLPVELQVEKALGISGKQQIENIVPGDKRASIEQFNAACKTSVMEHRQEFEDMTKRIGFWLDMANPYITYEPSYVESVWWVFKQIWDAGLVYKSAQGGAALPALRDCAVLPRGGARLQERRRKLPVREVQSHE